MPYITLENGKRIKISKESYEALAKAVKEEDREILVPDNIKIGLVDTTGKYWFGDGLGIVFNDEEQILLYDVEERVWKVWEVSDEEFVECKLVPVDKEDLKAGYTYFRTDFKFGTDKFFVDLEDIISYCKYLGNDKYVYTTHDGDIVTNDIGWIYWYQVVPINEN